MPQTKPIVEVFVTKSRKFRAKVKEVDGFKYEVTIGGSEWNKGKGRQYESNIMQKCSNLIAAMQNEFENFKK